MRKRDIERKVKKVLQDPDFKVEVWHEDQIVRVSFLLFDSKPLTKLLLLLNELDATDATIFPDNDYFYIDFYFND
jgi:hypothetical protein